ncbi:MAG: choice-of-anchor tandem repeat NxxGxxAF-containing protein [Limisphaerales bacterium]
MLFEMFLRINQAPFEVEEGILLVGPDTELRMMRSGSATPEGQGVFTFIMDSVSLNDRGEYGLYAILGSSGGVFGDEYGIYRVGANSTEKIARTSDPLPGGRGEFQDFTGPSLNNQGEAAFTAWLAGTGTRGDRGIYLWTADRLVELARQFDPSPDGVGKFVIPDTVGIADFSGLFVPVVNDRGDVLFKAMFSGGEDDSYVEEGFILVARDGTRHLVARVNQALEGSHVVDLGIAGESESSVSASMAALNGSGRVAFRATLSDGRQGIFLWSSGAVEPPHLLEAPRISRISRQGERVAIQLPSQVGFEYVLQVRESLETGQWLEIGPPQTGTGQMLEFTVNLTGGRNTEFFRVSVFPVLAGTPSPAKNYGSY